MASWKQQALIEAPVAEVWRLLCDPERASEWGEDMHELIKAKRGIQGRAIGALHTKSFLRRATEKALDGLRRAVGRPRLDTSPT